MTDRQIGTPKMIYHMEKVRICIMWIMVCAGVYLDFLTRGNGRNVRG